MLHTGNIQRILKGRCQVDIEQLHLKFIYHITKYFFTFQLFLFKTRCLGDHGDRGGFLVRPHLLLHHPRLLRLQALEEIDQHCLH